MRTKKPMREQPATRHYKTNKKVIDNRRGGRTPPCPAQPKEQLNTEWSRWKWHLLIALIVVITLGSYANCLTNQFVFDDIHIILKNPSIRGIEKIPNILGLREKGGSYRPVRMISYAVDFSLNRYLWRYLMKYESNPSGAGLTYSIGPFTYHFSSSFFLVGLNPFGYHISNIAYHLVTTLMVFLIVSSLVTNKRIAFMTAFLFALHPVHTDSVTYLSGRRDILCTLFYLSGFYFFLRYRRTNRFRFILCSFLAYLLSLGSKEMGVTLPAVFFCFDLIDNFNEKVCRTNSTYFKELLLAFKGVFLRSKYFYTLIFSGTFLFAYYKVFIKSPSNQNSYYGDSMWTTFFTVGKILVHYVKLLLFPINLNADYSYNAFPLSPSFFEPSTLCAFIVLGILGYGVLQLMKTHKMMAFGMIWFFVTLLPVCHIFPHHELLAEHYLYLPSFGFCLLMACFHHELLKERQYRFYIYASFVAVLLLFSIRIVDRNRDWKDAFSLWAKTVRTSPLCARARNNLGAEFDKKGMIDKAIAEYEKAISIKPDYADPHNNLGFIYFQRGENEKAISAYKRAVDIKPRFAEARNNLGSAYLKNGMLDEAWSEFAKALKNKHWLAESYLGRGVVLAKKGELDLALRQFEKALQLKPYLAEVHNNLAATYYLKGDYTLALMHCDKAEKLGGRVSPQLLKRLESYR